MPGSETQEPPNAHFMELALRQAETAVTKGQTPFGAVRSGCPAG